jgi:2-polyprenyl-3-methyl-5-hydroxy-6-metoxy-1,4-benzoquinol methylase
MEALSTTQTSQLENSDSQTKTLLQTSIAAGHLGANAIEYTKEMSDEEEQQQFNWASKKIALLIETLQQLPQRERVADVGCRTGGQAAYYKAQAKIAEMHGFDISEAPLEVAKRAGIVTHVWISGESACPVEDNFFDAIIAGDIIEHLMDTDIFLQELQRVLRPGGYLLITTPNMAWWWNRIRLLFGKIPANVASVSFRVSLDPAVDLKHLRVSVNSEWLNLFAQHHLECVSIRGYNYPKLLRWPFNWFDHLLNRYPSLAHSNLFLLRKPVA